MSSHSILFVANHHKTILFRRISERLERDGFKSLWLSPSKLWTKWLLDSGVPPTSICTLDLEEVEASRPRHAEAWTSIQEVEAKSKHNVFDLVLMDRILRQKNPQQVSAYVAYIELKMTAFLAPDPPQARAGCVP